MSISNTAIIGCIIALFVLIIVCTIIILVILCVTSRITVYDKHQNIEITRPSIFQNLFTRSKPQIDLEKQYQSNYACSTIALKSLPFSIPNQDKSPRVSDDGEIIVTLSRENEIRDNIIIPTSKSDYRSAIESFNSETNGLIDDQSYFSKQSPESSNLTRRISSLHYQRNEINNTVKTLIAIPNEQKQSYLADQYDSFSRTIMLQNLIEKSVNDDSQTIMKVKDPFSENLIVVGGIVVVIKPFRGTKEYEFSSLQPGDLLRIVKFFIKEEEDLEIKPLRIVSDKLQLTSDREGKQEILDNEDVKTIDGYKIKDNDNDNTNNEVYIDRSDSNYKNIHCTGIALSTCLEYNYDTSDLSLRFKDTVNNSDFEYLKDFPLEVVSLETTVLRSMNDTTISIDDDDESCSL
ncbi:uncharacterized protein RJT21DRAFT_25085 [Scheffersomyces amazonensis]|uniref:uncharacterized protein n=1 Tax=Scheffersomyces amazonensis TaxID=1078765 RepID=UPI00315CFBDB